MSKKYDGNCISITDIGLKRMSNDDKSLGLKNDKNQVLLCVFDGMGGHNQGSYAASTANQIFQDQFVAKRKFFSVCGACSWLKKTIRKANNIIYNKAQSNEEYHGSGTTLSIAMIIKHKLIIAHMGDSRIYKINEKDSLIQLTEDQTVAMHDYRAGLITKEEINRHPSRHILTNALGIYKRAKFDFKIIKYSGETVMVCSDGLYNNVSNSQINSILANTTSIEQKITELIHQANFNGGSDNIAISLWETI